MVAQPLTPGTELPPQFGALLAEATTGLPGRNYKPKQMQQEISRLERDVRESERLVNLALVGFVEFVRDAGQDDDAARKFDDWTDDLDLAQAFAAYEEKVVPGLKQRAAILRQVVEGWRRMAEAGLIEPDLPPQLVEQIAQLDVRIRELTGEVTKREDNELIARLLIRVAGLRPLTDTEALRMYDAARVPVPAPGYPSVHRSDWYDDDGR